MNINSIYMYIILILWYTADTDPLSFSAAALGEDISYIYVSPSSLPPSPHLLLLPAAH